MPFANSRLDVVHAASVQDLVVGHCLHTPSGTLAACATIKAVAVVAVLAAGGCTTTTASFRTLEPAELDIAAVRSVAVMRFRFCIRWSSCSRFRWRSSGRC